MDVLSTGVAAAWTGADMSARLLPEVVPGIDADKASFYESRGVGHVLRLTREFVKYSENGGQRRRAIEARVLPSPRQYCD